MPPCHGSARSRPPVVLSGITCGLQFWAPAGMAVAAGGFPETGKANDFKGSEGGREGLTGEPGFAASVDAISVPPGNAYISMALSSNGHSLWCPDPGTTSSTDLGRPQCPPPEPIVRLGGLGNHFPRRWLWFVPTGHAAWIVRSQEDRHHERKFKADISQHVLRLQEDAIS